MADPTYDTEGLSEETAALAALGRGKTPEGKTEDNSAEDPKASTEGDPADDQNDAPKGSDETPEWVPEKFRKDGKADYEALAKAYAELEKKLGAPKEEASQEDDDKGDDKDGDDADPEAAFRETVQKTVTSAQEEYAKDGKLSDDSYKALTDLLGQTYVDNYLAGVKALEQSLTQAVYETAGGEDVYMAAVEWARENWSETKIEKFDAAINDEDLMPTLVRDLVNSYRDANPGEGKSTRPGVGVAPEDVYTDPREFTDDLAKAEAEGDMLARSKAVKKLQRSKKAGTIKGITPRTGLSRFG